MGDYDVCVIGAGPAGFAAAIRAWDFGKRVCLVERARLGGAGLHDGALSSKTLWELSRDYRRALQQDRGYSFGDVSLDYMSVQACVEAAVSAKAEYMQTQLQALSEPHEHGGYVRLHLGSARFLDPHSIEIDKGGGDTEKVTADHFVLATGSKPRILPDIAVDGYHIMTSDHICRLEKFPRSLVILGAGVVGCEFATIFANFGKTQVNLIDRADRILPFEDPDISEIVSGNFQSKGLTVHGKSRLLSMRTVEGQVEYKLAHGDGREETFFVDHALISVGRVPNTEGLGLEALGVELDDRGHVVDHDTQTSVPHIYAVGDVTFDIALVSVGEIEGRHAAEKICGVSKHPLSYDNLSTIMFLDPEVAAIGLNEIQAQAKKIPYRVATYGYALVNRAIAMRQTDGFLKLLVSTDDDMHILGMRALGVHASTTLEAVSLAINGRRSARELAELLHPHPAITEGLQECVRVLLRTSVYKPFVFPSVLGLRRIRYDCDGTLIVETEN